MNIKVLGACCQKSTETFENAKLAVKELGIDATVENIGDMMQIVGYGVMATPALVINEKVVSYGRLLNPKEIIKLIQKASL